MVHKQKTDWQPQQAAGSKRTSSVAYVVQTPLPDSSGLLALWPLAYSVSYSAATTDTVSHIVIIVPRGSRVEYIRFVRTAKTSPARPGHFDPAMPLLKGRVLHPRRLLKPSTSSRTLQLLSPLTLSAPLCSSSTVVCRQSVLMSFRLSRPVRGWKPTRLPTELLLAPALLPGAERSRAAGSSRAAQRTVEPTWTQC